jgi:hypothetical protein
VTRDGDYVLNIAPDVIDMHRFRNLVSDARHAESDDDVRLQLRAAVALWRGPGQGHPCLVTTGTNEREPATVSGLFTMCPDDIAAMPAVPVPDSPGVTVRGL